MKNFGAFLAVAETAFHHQIPCKMINQTVYSLKSRALELGISEEIFSIALHIISQNKDLVNAMDNCVEMDDYIYRAVLKDAFEKRKAKAEIDLYINDPALQAEAQKDLTILSREELASDPFYRAVLPLIAKIVHESVLRLHAEEASAIILKLADFKRKHRATSLTEIIVKRCSAEIEGFTA
jgi:hypothetical protein